eukprot:GEMP01101459.1.p1 GENE.GEMP01101459.1~~GEMP01101459.1.p1  ORF type:complete len:163 (-),score=21.32 GEMP01101459.1:134-622(-)
MVNCRIIFHAYLMAQVITPCTCSFVSGAQSVRGVADAVRAIDDAGVGVRSSGDNNAGKNVIDEPILSMSMMFLPDDDLQVPLEWPLGRKIRSRNQKFQLNVHSKAGEVEGRLGNLSTNLTLLLEGIWKSLILWIAMLCLVLYCLSVHFNGQKIEDEKSFVLP